MAFTASILTAFSILPQLVPLRRTSFLSEEEICDEKPPATAKAITHAPAVKRAGSAPKTAGRYILPRQCEIRECPHGGRRRARVPEQGLSLVVQCVLRLRGRVTPVEDIAGDPPHATRNETDEHGCEGYQEVTLFSFEGQCGSHHPAP